MGARESVGVEVRSGSNLRYVSNSQGSLPMVATPPRISQVLAVVILNKGMLDIPVFFHRQTQNSTPLGEKVEIGESVAHGRGRMRY